MRLDFTEERDKTINPFQEAKERKAVPRYLSSNSLLSYSLCYYMNYKRYMLLTESLSENHPYGSSERSNGILRTEF